MLFFVEGLRCAAGMDTNGAIGIREFVAELKGVLCVLETSGCNEEMGAANLLSTFDYFIAVAGMVASSSELFICEVGSDIEERKSFFH